MIFLKKRCGLSVYEVGSYLKGIRPTREFKMGVMNECKPCFNEMTVTTFQRHHFVVVCGEQ